MLVVCAGWGGCVKVGASEGRGTRGQKLCRQGAEKAYRCNRKRWAVKSQKALGLFLFPFKWAYNWGGLACMY